jgi:hypothetical protein
MPRAWVFLAMSSVFDAQSQPMRIGPACWRLLVPALVPGIHVLHLAATKDVDGRGKPGHDGKAGGVRREAQAASQ